MSKKKKIMTWVILIVGTLITIYLTLAILSYRSGHKALLGVTFSKQYASYLGLDWKESYLSILNDLKVKYLRLPIYWEDVEKEDGRYDFTDVDWQLNEAKRRDVKVVLVIGMRQPRWPECHFPAWLKANDSKVLHDKNTRLLTAEILRYRNHPEVESWQLENEPLLNSFGICPKADYAYLKTEVDYVHQLDRRPIIITASGELSTWWRESRLADILGSTLYRRTWDHFLGYTNYWMVPPSWYRIRAYLLKDLKNYWIMELQAEPWAANGDIFNLTTSEQFKTMSADKLRSNVEFGNSTGAGRQYLWGAEWWYYLKTKMKNEELWQAAKALNW